MLYDIVYLRRGAPTLAHRMEGVGGNGAASQWGDPDRRERSQTGMHKCST